MANSSDKANNRGTRRKYIWFLISLTRSTELRNLKTSSRSPKSLREILDLVLLLFSWCSQIGFNRDHVPVMHSSNAPTFNSSLCASLYGAKSIRLTTLSLNNVHMPGCCCCWVCRAQSMENNMRRMQNEMWNKQRTASKCTKESKDTTCPSRIIDG